MEKILFTSILEENTVGIWENYFDKPLRLGIKPPKDAQVTKDTPLPRKEVGPVTWRVLCFAEFSEEFGKPAWKRRREELKAWEKRKLEVQDVEGRESEKRREETAKWNDTGFTAKVGGGLSLFV